MPESKVRRLFNIRPEHVSLVDKAANKRKFVVVKRKGVEPDMADEMKEVLKGLDDRLEAIDKRLGNIEKAEPVTFLTVDKAGAKFSTTTLSQLKATISALQKLIGEGEPEPLKKKEEELTAEQLTAAITKGIGSGLKEEKKPSEFDANKLAKALGDALKSVIGKEE